MKYFSGNVDPSPSYEGDEWEDHSSAWAFRAMVGKVRGKIDPQPLEDDVRSRLEKKAAPRKTRPPLRDIVLHTPDVVAWLRSEMTARRVGDSDSITSSKPGSRPPFRIACMNAADREVAALAYWCHHYGIKPAEPAFRTHGRVAGVYTDRINIVFELSEAFAEMLNTTHVGEEVSTDPVWGLWTIRSQNYATWPQLATLFEADKPTGEESSEELTLL